jgi:hypothetical protein
MRLERFRRGCILALLSCTTLGIACAADANLLVLNFSNSGSFSGTPPNPPSNPSDIYATATFDDHGGTGSVTLTMEVLNTLLAGAYVNDWYFNLDPSFASDPTITYASGQAADSVESSTLDGYKADGTGGLFDFAFHFPTANPGQLGIGNTSVYTLALAGINAASFNVVSALDNGGAGGNYAAIHTQGYSSSDWVASGPPVTVKEDAPLPEPGTFFLLAAALLAYGVARGHRIRT